jgi:hypothetical protein
MEKQYNLKNTHSIVVALFTLYSFYITDSPYIQQPKSKLKSQLKIQKHCSNTKEQQHEDSQTQNLHPNEKHEQQHHKSAEPKLNQIEIELKPNEIDDKI